MSGAGTEALPHPTALGGLIDTLARWLDKVVATFAVALLLVETVLLFAGVVFRYLLHKPLVWSDEVNAILFLWLGILGAVLAVRRWRHMRMSTFVIRLSAHAQSIISDLGTALIAVLLCLLLPPALEHVSTEAGVITPSLELSQAWRAAAMPVGIVLMLIETLLRLHALAATTGDRGVSRRRSRWSLCFGLPSRSSPVSGRETSSSSSSSACR